MKTTSKSIVYDIWMKIKPRAIGLVDSYSNLLLRTYSHQDSIVATPSQKAVARKYVRVLCNNAA